MTSPRIDRLIRLIAAGLLGLAVLLAGAAPAGAVICATDTVPAATLLLPYFEVNLADPNGLTTLFSVNDASAVAVLAHVVVWSDLAVPVMSFDLYLTGYDVQTINLRDLLVHGSVAPTASAGQDPNDTVSPKGIFSQDINYPSCDGRLPPVPTPSAAEIANVQAALTGQPTPLFENLCAGRNLGDDVARGYITVDTVRHCTLRVPGDAGYFAADASGDATDQNVLWGNWYIVNSTHNYAQGSPLVAIEANPTDPATTTPGRYTFYGRYDGWTAIDHREPLATTFAAQYAIAGNFEGQADVILWRDPKVAQGPFPCPAAASRPAWYPLAQEGLQIFDEEEHAVVFPLFPVDGPPPPVPLPGAAATQRTRVDSAALPVPFNFGWLYFDLNLTAAGQTNPASDPTAAQAWVLSVQSADGRFATAADAFRLDSACAPNHFTPGN
jgi:hypothetical protein